MDESQRRAWRALGLGPEWAARAPDGALPSAQVPGDETAGAVPAPGAIAAADLGGADLGGADLGGARAAAADVHSAPEDSSPVDPASSDPVARHAAPIDPPAIAPSELDADGGAPTPARRRAIEIAGLDWQPLREQVAACTACGLCRTRSRTVFGVGATTARWMLVGEAPGAEEDAKGEPFVGKAGQLLDAMLGAIGLDRRADVFIANVLKCRPPRNRDPLPEEVGACEPFLLRQLELVAPDVVLVLGRFAAQSVLGTDASIASLRGKVHRKEVGGRSIPLVVTYHPAYLLRTPADKSKSWADLLLARRAAQR